ncbi:hypothetical protein MASR2M39_05340 [Ignavibacteriales bacterium]
MVLLNPANLKSNFYRQYAYRCWVGNMKRDDFGESWKGAALGYKFRHQLIIANGADFCTLNGFAVGDRGLIMKTVNAGNS